MKKPYILLISALMGAAAFDASAGYKGDLNGDGKVDLADMAYLAKAIKSGTADSACDINSSGKVDDTDLQKLADIILSGKLTEDSGMNVGIGGWDDSGEDFGGTVRAPRKSSDIDVTLKAEMEYNHNDNSLFMNIYLCGDVSSASSVLCGIEMPNQISFNIEELETIGVLDSNHKYYGTPIKSDRTTLRFMVFSPDFIPFSDSDEVLVARFRYRYFGDTNWPTSLTFSGVQLLDTNGDCISKDNKAQGGYWTYIPVKSAEIDLRDVPQTIKTNDRIPIFSRIEPEHATIRDVKFSSDNEDIANIEQDSPNMCWVNIKKPGTFHINMQSLDYGALSDTKELSVSNSLVQIILQSDAELHIGDNLTLIPQTVPSNVDNNQIVWSSSNTEVVNVDSNGKVTAIGIGEAEVKAVDKDNPDVFGSCLIRVNPILVSNVTLNSTSLNLNEGEKANLIATVTPDNATDNSVTWSSSNPSVASVENGTVTAISEGEATITATANDGSEVSASCTVMVSAKVIAAESITLDNTVLSLTEGDIATLTATVTPSDATNKSIIWSSSDSSVATVENGTVTAVSAGTATITASCGNLTASCTVTVAAKVIAAESISLNTESLSIFEDETATLIVTITPTDATDKSVSWSSDNTSVVTVDAYGKVTAVSAGTATITVTSAENSDISASCTVTVIAKTIPVEGITLDNTVLSLTEGDLATLTATINPDNATDKYVSWSSDNASVATVDAYGNVTAVSAGTATITATSSNGITASCTVTVAAKIIAAESISLSQESAQLKVGETATLIATVNPDNATDKTITWSSSDSSVASVDNGTVTAISLGTAIITASCGGASASCTVTVVATPVESISLNTESLSLTEGERANLTATISPLDATYKTVSWSSSDSSVASVSYDGIVTAVKVGTATITATADGKSAECSVEVKANIIPVTQISISNSELSLTEGDIATLTATINPDNATDKSVSWSSDNASVATVDAYGNVTAVSAGTATITATSSNGITASCTVTVAAKIIAAESISLSQESAQLKVGETVSLNATVLPENTTVKTIYWSSDNSDIATVDENGNVTAKALGIAIITASCGGASASCTVTVVATPVESISLNTESLSLTEGERANLTATISPLDATYKTVSWSSSDSSVASVSYDGIVTAVKVGNATITATADGKSAECSVEVKANIIPVTQISISNSELSLTEGGTATLTATINPDNATDKSITWSSSDSSVASVENGKVTAVSAGTAIITATSSNGITVSCTVTVAAKGIAAESITLDYTVLSLTEGETATLTATVTPSDATDKSVTWSSSNPSVASVENGKVTAVSAGTATITASCGNLTASCTVNVAAKIIYVESITLDNSVLNLTAGETATLTHTIVPENATDKSVEWTSSDTSVATVDANGNVTVLKEGTCVITVSTLDGSSLSAQCTITGVSGIDMIFSDPDAQVDVYNMNGILVKRGCSRTDLKQLSSGIYILRQTSGASTVYIHRNH